MLLMMPEVSQEAEKVMTLPEKVELLDMQTLN